jgi:hypothetical protein
LLGWPFVAKDHAAKKFHAVYDHMPKAFGIIYVGFRAIVIVHIFERLSAIVNPPKTFKVSAEVRRFQTMAQIIPKLIERED